jgi:NDP-sugar pyrophosphorylase family protein
MSAIILAGGRGTRLRPLTVYTPKPIVPIANRPLVEYQIENLVRAGFSDICLSLSYQPNRIESLIGDGSQIGANVTYITEPSPLGTAGAYRFASKNDGPALVLNGDILTNIDLSRLVRQHKETKALVTIAAVEVEDASNFGVLKLGSDGQVIEFVEKPKEKAPQPSFINAGIYLIEPALRKYIQENSASSFELNVFPTILEAGEKVFAFRSQSDYWIDVGNPLMYKKANLDLIAGCLNSIFPKSGNAQIATRASVDQKSILGDGCIIKPGAVIENSVLGPGVQVEEKAVIKNSVIWSHTRIASAAVIHDSIVCSRGFIGKSAELRSGSVIGDGCSVPDYSIV